jgi:hypothetical protein
MHRLLLLLLLLHAAVLSHCAAFPGASVTMAASGAAAEQV